MGNNKFVLSSSEFTDLKSAEEKVTSWWKNGTLKKENVKLYEVVSIYDLKLKFVKRKNVKG